MSTTSRLHESGHRAKDRQTDRQTDRPCLALAKKDTSVILCRTCEQRKNGKTVREKCHWKHQQASCDCNMSTLMAQQNTTRNHRNESYIEANLIIAKNHKNITSTGFFFDKGKAHAGVRADRRKAKIQQPPNTNTTTVNAKKRSATGCHPGNFASKKTSILNSVRIANCGFVLCVVML